MNTLQNSFVQFFETNKSRIISQVMSHRQQLDGRLTQLKEKLPKEINPENENAMIDHYITLFVELLFGVMNSNPVLKSHDGIISNECVRPLNTFKELSSTFPEDVELVGEDPEKYPFVIKMVDLYRLREEQLSTAPRSLLSTMKNKSTGKATFHRAKQFLEFYLLMLMMENFSTVVIDDISSNNGSMNGYDMQATVQYMVTNQLAKASKGIIWWTSIVRGRLDQYLRWSCKQLVGDNASLSEFVERISSLFKQWFEKRILSPMERRWAESTNLYCNHLPQDICVKTLLYVAVGPNEDIIFSKDMVKRASNFPKRHAIPRSDSRKLNDDENNLRKVKSAIRNLRNDWEEMDSEEDAFRKALGDLGLNALKSNFGAFKNVYLERDNDKLEAYLMELMEESKPREFDDDDMEKVEDLSHHEKMIDWIENIRRSFKEHGKNFSVADAVQGGYQTIKQAPRQLVDHDYIRSVAYENYLMVLCRFLFDFDASYANYFHSTLDPRVMSHPIQFIRTTIFDESFKKEDLVRIFNEEGNRIQQEYNEKLNELKNFDDIINKLR